ncbi:MULTISPECIES: DUF4926 domain-containing protein [unclassified Methylobacterium]|jgi:Domain of unknown function (DUF4926)|uniref:DUF4926 domain-containing protein n=1 Tax=unclassified Methylobacterium TaxID=2615210 RepID=UPI0013559CFB|nr:DUF4926 domain-containing protein [Methylobacterium sp. 2A]MWV21226.1 DUF4926 domain-containing protein [Methylobacterium sp. 2A]
MSFDTLYQSRAPVTQPQALAELSVVALLRDVVTDDGVTVPAGTEGTIVGVWGGGEAYEVEFDEPVVGNATVQADALRSV